MRSYILSLAFVLVACAAARAGTCVLPAAGFMQYGSNGVESSVRNEIAPHVRPDKSAVRALIDSGPGRNRFTVVQIMPTAVWHRKYRDLIIADWQAMGYPDEPATALRYASDEWLIGFRAKNDKRIWWVSSGAMYIPTLGGFLHTHATCTPQ